jgi:hypothetical protein
MTKRKGKPKLPQASEESAEPKSPFPGAIKCGSHYISRTGQLLLMLPAQERDPEWQLIPRKPRRQPKRG